MLFGKLGLILCFIIIALMEFLIASCRDDKSFRKVLKVAVMSILLRQAWKMPMQASLPATQLNRRMLATRKEFQLSMNFLAPIKTWRVTT